MEKDEAMKKRQAFTVIELLVVIAIIAVLVGLLFPAIGAVQRHAKQTENGTKVRGIIQAMIQSSESRRKFFPGFDGFSFIPNGLATTGNSGIGQTVEARFWILLDGNYTDGEALISPQEVKDPWTVGAVTTNNYSYAMMKIASSVDLTPAGGRNAVDRYRREEWRNEQHAQAPLVSDRLTAGPANTVQGLSQPNAYESYHDGGSRGNWIGSIGFGDLHVEFSKTPLIDTRIAGYANSADTTGQDDIFAQLDTSAGPADINKNAAMVYNGFDNPVGPAN
jgi:prepilin-type N-terminal cleavage/methylation domain-containing protein